MKKKIFLVIVSIIVSIRLAAQGQITGNVVDENNEPLIGATVKTPNGKVGVITDIDGNFKMNVPEGTKSINIGYVGYEQKSEPLRFGKSKYNIRLSEKTTDLKDVVVIGYGTVKKANVTTAISSVDMDDMQDRAVDNVGAMLQGELAGVEVNTQGGPGGQATLNVRGAVAFDDESTTNPLYVVDGVIMDSDFDLNTLNPSDIQSVDVLKDASAAAIYGNMAANGVVIINMRKGKKGEKLSISANASFSIDQVMGKMDVMSGSQWSSWMNNLMNSNYMATANRVQKGGASGDDFIMQTLSGRVDQKQGLPTYSPKSNTDPRWTMEGHPGLSYIDWQDLVFHNAIRQNYGISASGGGANHNFRLSVSYSDADGVINNSNNKRLTLNFSGEASTANGKLTVGATIQPTFSRTEGGSVTGNVRSNASLNILNALPVAEQTAGANTTYQDNMAYIYATVNSMNPYHYNDEYTSRSSLFTMTTSAYVKAKILPWLQAKVQGSWNMRADNRNTYRPTVTKSANYYIGSTEGYYSESSYYGTRNHNFRVEATVDLHKKWGKHDVSGTLGWSINKTVASDTYRGEFSEFPSDAIISLPNALYASSIDNLSFTINPNATGVSLFGRAIYSYDDRYIINASVRRDGSSKFSSNNRWATFPAFSGAWNVHHEKFWKKNPVIKTLKVRLSFGETGRDNIPSNAYITSLSNTKYYDSDESSAYVAYRQGQYIGNEDLEWQKTQSWNIGMDAGLLNNRLSFSLDFFRTKTSNILYRQDMPAIAGFTAMYTNVGANLTKGIDLSIKSVNITKKDLKWTTSFNMGTTTSEVLSLGQATKSTCGFQSTQIREVGETVGEFWLYQAVGVFKTQEELDDYPHITGAKVGDLKLLDVDGDGQITEDGDRVASGRPTPAVTMGLNNCLTWKRWTLNIRATAQFGGHIFGAAGISSNASSMNGQSFNGMWGSTVPTGNMLSSWENMWLSESEQGDGYTPSVMATKSNINMRSTYYLYSSDFIKLASISLSYNIPVKKSWWLKSAVATFNVENVARWDKYDAGFSPEGRYVQSGSSSYDCACYPLSRSYTLSLKCNF